MIETDKKGNNLDLWKWNILIMKFEQEIVETK